MNKCDAIGSEFVEWWKNHRHSGFCSVKDQRLGHEVFYWGITPRHAWKCARYRVEFEDATGTDTRCFIGDEPAFKMFSREDRERWRQEQKLSEAKL